MKPGLLALESLRYLFGQGSVVGCAQADGAAASVWDSLESTSAAVRSMRENCHCHGAAMLVAPTGFAAEAVYQRAVAHIAEDPGTLCLRVPNTQPGSAEGSLESHLLKMLTQAAWNEGRGSWAQANLDWQAVKQLLAHGDLPWKRVVFALERADAQVSALWLQPGSRTAGALRRLLAQFRASDGRLGLIGFLDTCRLSASRPGLGEGGRQEAIVAASGEELSCLSESFPGLVTLLGHLDVDGLSALLRGPLLQVRREQVVADLEAHPDLRRRLANCLRLLPQWRASGVWYPLHPIAWAALPRLCAAFPHPERSFWGFFENEIPGSLPYFLGNSKILSPHGEPNLYVLDSLVPYFEPIWHTREWASAWEELEQTCRRGRNHPLSRRLLRSLWILQVLQHSAFPTTEAFLLESLQLSPRETEVAQKSLRAMSQEGLLLQEGAGEELCYFLPLPGLAVAGVATGRREARVSATWQNFLRRFPDTSDLQSELRARLPLRRLKLYTFNRTHCSDRWVRIQLTTYQGLQGAGGANGTEWLEAELASLGCRPDYQGDLLLLYVALLDHEERQMLQSQLLSGQWRHPRLILAYPKSESAPLRSARQELRLLSAYRWATRLIMPYCDSLSPEAQEWASKVEQLQGMVAGKFRQFFSPENLDFFCAEGGVESNLDIAGLHRLLHERFMRVEGEPPLVADPVFACATDRPAYRRVRRGAVSLLLEGNPQIPLWEHAGRTFQALIRGLIDTSLANVIEQGPSWHLISRPGAKVWSMDAPGWTDVYGLLEDHLLRASQQRDTFEKALHLVRQPPYSLTWASCELILAVFFWSHGSSCQLYREGEPLAGLTADVVADIVAHPHLYSLRYASQSNDAQGFLLGVILELDRDFQVVEGVDLWKAAARRLLDWYRMLDERTVAIGRERTPFNRPLLELLGRLQERSMRREEGVVTAAGLNERRLFERSLPAALGFSVEGRRNWPMETQPLLDRFRMIRVSIERAVSSTRELIHLGLTEIFFEPTLTLMGRQLDWPTLLQRWHENLPESTRSVALETRIHRLVADLAVCGGEPDSLLDYSLAQLGYPPVEHWMQDYVPEILERFRLVKEQVEHADLIGLFPSPPQLRWQRLEEFLRRGLMRVDLSREELRAIVGAELEYFWDR